MTTNEAMLISDNLRTEISVLQKQHNDCLNEWAITTCPYKVGDIIGVPDAAYSYNGKTCRVKSVSGRFDCEINANVQAIVLKKDGTDSSNVVEWRWKDK